MPEKKILEEVENVKSLMGRMGLLGEAKKKPAGGNPQPNTTKRRASKSGSQVNTTCTLTYYNGESDVFNIVYTNKLVFLQGNGEFSKFKTRNTNTLLYLGFNTLYKTLILGDVNNKSTIYLSGIKSVKYAGDKNVARRFEKHASSLQNDKDHQYGQEIEDYIKMTQNDPAQYLTALINLMSPEELEWYRKKIRPMAQSNALVKQLFDSMDRILAKYGLGVEKKNIPFYLNNFDGQKVEIKVVFSQDINEYNIKAGKEKSLYGKVKENYIILSLLNKNKEKDSNLTLIYQNKNQKLFTFNQEYIMLKQKGSRQHVMPPIPSIMSNKVGVAINEIKKES